jgi:YbbR domain-containing protein
MRTIDARPWWQRFTSDLPLKLGAIFTAMLLWYAATEDRRATVTRTLEIPLIVQGLSAQRAVSDLPSTVRATLRGPRVSLENLEPKDLEASIDVSSATEGFFSMDVRLRAPDGLSRIAVQPSRVSGSLELLVARSVPVRLASFETRPPGSQDLSPLRLQPRFVTASGRRADAERVTYALAVATQLPGRGATLEVRLTAVDERGEPVEGVTLEPARVRVSL